MRCGLAAYIFLGVVANFLSADPIDHWQRRASNTGLVLESVAFGSNRFVTVGQWGAVLVSSNGADWVIGTTTITETLYGVAFGVERFIAVGDGGLIFSSGDGFNWTARASTTTNALKGVRWLNDRFIATGANGTLLSSPDGLAWTQHATGSPHMLNAVAYGRGLYVAVGEANSNPTSIAYSTDGVTWSNQIRNFIALYDVAFGGDRFAALGIRGRVYISTNAMDWEELFQTVDTRYLFGITHIHGRFVAVGGPFGGGSQKIVTSLDGYTWTLHSVDSNHSGTLRGVAYGDSTFVAVGDKGLILQSDSFFRLAPAPLAAEGRVWTFTADPGRRYRFQYSTAPAGSAWIDITNFTGNPEPITLNDPNPAVANRFYRVASP